SAAPRLGAGKPGSVLNARRPHAGCMGRPRPPLAACALGRHDCVRQNPDRAGPVEEEITMRPLLLAVSTLALGTATALAQPAVVPPGAAANMEKLGDFR